MYMYMYVINQNVLDIGTENRNTEKSKRKQYSKKHI